MMIDHIESRMWADHHAQFSDWVGDAANAVRGALARLPAWDGTTHQLMALVASFAITALSFNATA